jgi:import receptor subunit TOM20
MLLFPNIAYAVYFDYKRRSEPEFRRSLRRNERHRARVEKEDQKAQSQLQRQKIRLAVQAAIEDGFPRDPSEREMYFMEQVSKGEVLSADRKFSLSPEEEVLGWGWNGRRGAR